MFGTVGRLTVKPGKLDEMVALMGEWERDVKPTVDGAVASYVYKLEGKENQLLLAVVFRDRESYMANADSDRQDAWYRKMRELLDGVPSWEDGEIVHAG